MLKQADVQRLEYTVRELYGRLSAKDWEVVLDFLDDDVRMASSFHQEWTVGSKRVIDALKDIATKTATFARFELSDVHVELMGSYFGVATFYVKCSYGQFPATVLASLFAGEWCVRLFSV